MQDNVDFNQPCEDMEVSVSCKEVVPEVAKTLYKDTLLTMAGSSRGEDLIDMEEISEDIPNPKDTWYQDFERENQEERPFDPCPVIPISKEEFDEWCKPWCSALFVKLLGKRVGGSVSWNSVSDVIGICFTCSKYGHRSDMCQEALVKKPANNEKDGTVQANAESSNQTLVDRDSKEGKNEEFGISSHDNQGCIDFRPCMMVKRPNRRKKVSSYQGKSGKINSHDSEEKQEKFYEGSNHANGNGSRFNTLYEEGRESTFEDQMHEETKMDANVADGLVPPKAQKDATKSHSIQKKILKVGAGKNPQGGKKNTPPKPWSVLTEKRGKPNSKLPSKQTSSHPEASRSTNLVTPKKKNEDAEVMERVVIEYMQNLQREQYVMILAEKAANQNKGGFVIRDNPLTLSPTHSASLMAVDSEQGLRRGEINPRTMVKAHPGGSELEERESLPANSSAQNGGHAQKRKVVREGRIFVTESVWIALLLLKQLVVRVEFGVCGILGRGKWMSLSTTGDFNAILHDHERRGGSVSNNPGAYLEFQSCVADCRLLDLGFMGWPFTWKRGNLVERLDRGLSNLNWQITFLEAVVKHLPNLNSDHSPICLQHTMAPTHNRNRRPFRFVAA
ncbi:hypothetical protein AHAS_Ahas18G0166100 [Arachis hypogaea]